MSLITEDKTLQEYLEVKQVLANILWDPKILKLSNPSISKLYQTECEAWVKNADTFLSDYPREVSILQAELLNSDFTLKFMLDWMPVTDLSEWSLEQKVSFVKTCFESSYQYFSFLTFCAIYPQNNPTNWFSKWYIPLEAKEMHRKKNRWNYDGQAVSGKIWILEQCPLFNLNKSHISTLRKIRNSGSHDSLKVIDSRVFLLDEARTRDITEGIESLVPFLFDCVSVCVHFNIRLLVKHNFWLSPAIVLSLPNLFDYKKRVVQFNIFSELNKKEGGLNLKNAPALSNVMNAMFEVRGSLANFFKHRLATKYAEVGEKDLKLKIEECVMGTLHLLTLYGRVEIWQFLAAKEDFFNKLFAHKSKKVDVSKIPELMERVQEETLNMLNEMAEAVSHINIPQHKKNSAESLDFTDIDSFKVASKRFLSASKQQPALAYAFLNVFMIYCAFRPLILLVDAFPELVIDA